MGQSWVQTIFFLWKLLKFLELKAVITFTFVSARSFRQHYIIDCDISSVTISNAPFYDYLQSEYILDIHSDKNRQIRHKTRPGGAGNYPIPKRVAQDYLAHI